MNKFNFIYCIILSFFVVSCLDLDVPIKTIVSEEDMYKNENSVMGIIARIYAGSDNPNSPIEGFSPKEGTGELVMRGSSGSYAFSNTESYWVYDNIRVINSFIETLPKYKNNYKESSYNSFLGEAYFMRAYTYFKMVRIYGGVPIIDRVIDYSTTSAEEMQVPRNTEKEVYDFVLKDLDEAIQLLSINKNSERASKYTAYALKSRVALYVASLAKYQKSSEKGYKGGVIGIPTESAADYYKTSFEASLEVEKSGYDLYNKYPADPVKNFSQLFLDKTDNPERILVRTYLATDKYNGHDFDLLSRPYQLRGNADGATFDPTLDMIEEFENTDGTLLKNGWRNPDGSLKHYNNPMDAFVKADPRLKAGVLLPWDVFQGEVIEVQAGIYESYDGNNPGILHISVNLTDEYNGRKILGESGMSSDYSATGIPGKMTTTGFHIRKYANESLANLISQASEQSWLDIRYAEILLNRAEAALELVALGITSHAGISSLQNDALNVVNKIRKRAQTFLYDKDVTLEQVRHERKLELAFENILEKDYLRWRTADAYFLSRKVHKLCPYYVDSSKDFVLIPMELSNQGSMTFSPTSYYGPISSSEYQKNPNLVQNPGYPEFK